MIEVPTSAKQHANKQQNWSPETMHMTSKKGYSTAKWLHSTSFHLKFFLITEHKVPFTITCEITKGWETKNLKRTEKAQFVTNCRSWVGRQPHFTKTCQVFIVKMSTTSNLTNLIIIPGTGIIYAERQH